MKNLICFLILLIFGGFIFYTGWTQIKIKPDTFAVVQSKTGGINQEPVLPGKYSWHWEFLLPTNAQLNIFELKPLNTQKTISGYNNGEYSFTFAISLSFTPEAVINLLNENFISNNDDLKSYLENAAYEISQNAAEFYIKKIKSEQNFNPDFIKRNDIMRALNLYDEFPDVDVTVFALTDYKFHKPATSVLPFDFESETVQDSVASDEDFKLDDGETE